MAQQPQFPLQRPPTVENIPWALQRPDGSKYIVFAPSDATPEMLDQAQPVLELPSGTNLDLSNVPKPPQQPADILMSLLPDVLGAVGGIGAGRAAVRAGLPLAKRALTGLFGAGAGGAVGGAATGRDPVESAGEQLAWAVPGEALPMIGAPIRRVGKLLDYLAVRESLPAKVLKDIRVPGVRQPTIPQRARSLHQAVRTEIPGRPVIGTTGAQDAMEQAMSGLIDQQRAAVPNIRVSPQDIFGAATEKELLKAGEGGRRAAGEFTDVQSAAEKMIAREKQTPGMGRAVPQTQEFGSLREGMESPAWANLPPNEQARLIAQLEDARKVPLYERPPVNPANEPITLPTGAVEHEFLPDVPADLLQNLRASIHRAMSPSYQKGSLQWLPGEERVQRSVASEIGDVLGQASPEYAAVNQRISSLMPARQMLEQAQSRSTQAFSPWELVLGGGATLGAIMSPETMTATMPLAAAMALRRPAFASMAGLGVERVGNVLGGSQPYAQGLTRLIKQLGGTDTTPEEQQRRALANRFPSLAAAFGGR